MGQADMDGLWVNDGKNKQSNIEEQQIKAYACKPCYYSEANKWNVFTDLM